ncbi:BZ3500_MvSof-1268-A1-R1_Chr2-2g05036 [Microbotryum saponariae]|uniref:BZ3500_MvSof-1268-A1-R1_Chr2-2g05036 protein n=1 Tax=Microbotryum saponariae TaxID=289078 RepID=A0A2X0M091_9BASI|nr:BZ3500_MvSof-1268-A1-R1_Chr2-2g05036 [Microbotryum saponariae]SDA00755.1 BZ3501_MvSof-1269-A2-R1_Chr2-2g04710 [Microbotryum saponariae]
MADDRFCYLHMPEMLSSQILLDEEDAKLGWDLPHDDIIVPAHLLPSYQDEDDETHPSYPYGNPYTPTARNSSTPYSRPSQAAFLSRGGGGGDGGASGGHGSNSSNRFAAARSLGPLLPGAKATANGPGSLATTLSNLELRGLFQSTTLGDAQDREWGEMGIASLLGIEEGSGLNDDPETLLRNAGIASTDGPGANGAGGMDPSAGGEAQGQNAGDHPDTEEEEEE